MSESWNKYWRNFKLITQEEMPKPKYDRNKLKKDFLDSEYREVKAFCTAIWLIYNSDTVRRTKGRSKEKVINEKAKIDKAIEKQIESDAEALSLDISFLAKAKKALVQRLIKKLIALWENCSVSDFTKAVECIRTEMELPTRYTKNENLNKEEKSELDEEEKEALICLFKKWRRREQ